MLNRKQRLPIILCAASLLLSALSSPAQVKTQTAPVKPPAAAPAPSPNGDTSALAKEAQDWLIDLIRINTTNPPGNEQVAANYIANVLEKNGIPAELLEVTPGRSALVARLRSSAVADPSKSLLLVAHMDVVGVDRPKWTVDPFGAVIKDGYIYGRGTIDDKGMLVANLAAFIALKRSNVHLNRDVIFLATCDEEGGGEASIKILIAKYWDKFAAGYAINEGGDIVVKDGKVRYIAIQASEKVSVNVAVVARGTAGHASRPTKDNAVVHLAAAVAKIGAYSAPVHFTSIVRRYFEQLATIEPDELAKWMRALDTTDRGEHAQKVVSEASPYWNSMMRDSIAPTMLSAGIRNNVIPAEARANLNIRLLPGNTINVLLAELTKLVNDPQIKFEVQPEGGLAAPPSSLESDFYQTISKVASSQFGNVPVLPLQSTVATDSAQLRLHNVQSYGLWPYPLSEEASKRMHGDDERLPLQSFYTGVDLMTRIVAEFAGSR